MDEAARLLTFLALAGGALTLVGGAFVWFLDETRRIQRTLTQALGAVPQPMLTARGRGVGVGFDLTTGLVVVTWDQGAWRLTYRLDELMGVELIVDRRVAARAFRGEARRPLEELGDPQDLVRLRFIFDDAGHPDFLVDLWRPEDEGRRGRLDADAALHEANRWIARIEAMLRRPVAPRTAAVAPPVRTGTPRPAPPQFDDEDSWADDPEDVIT
jgi:hypothetical protein